MIPNAPPRSIESSGVSSSAVFGISFEDSAHIMTILRDTLYSDKVLAVLREYSSNAWDSHRASGKGDVPIKITLPTHAEPTLSIRDFGSGLSHDDVFQVYTQYGASTKRGSDNTVGMLGIGSKSGFAYSDSFTVTSFHGGMRRTYVAVLDKSEKGVISLLHEEPCGSETGVLIQIAVRPNDIWEFTEKGKNLFRYFVPRPDINISLPVHEARSLVHGTFYENETSGVWVAVMGCVPYRINLEQLRNTMNPESGVAEFLFESAGALYFNIGEVQINASREELKYSEDTKTSLIARFDLLVEEYVRHTIETIKNGGFTPWERRLKAQVLRRLKLPFPKDCGELVSERVMLKDTVPESFKIHGNEDEVAKSILVSDGTRLILRDDFRALGGYGLREHDYLIRKEGKATWDEVKEDLKKFLEDSSLTGILVTEISKLPWTKPYRSSSGRTLNIKHRLRTFKFRAEHSWESAGSKAWDAVPEDWEPTKNDVFVLISGFKSKEYNFHRTYREDSNFSTVFGDGKMPVVYGYKSTPKHPVDPSTLLGTEYSKWSEAFIKTLLLNPKTIEIFENRSWAHLISSNWNWKYDETSKKDLKDIEKLYGKGHLVTQLLDRYLRAKEYLKTNKVSDELMEEFSRRAKIVNKDTESKKMFQVFKEKYKLFSIERFYFNALWSDDMDTWSHYINAVDEAEKAREKS